MTMRVSGQLYIVGNGDLRLPVQLDLETSFRILQDDGTVVASVDPRLVSMRRVGGGLFELEFADRKFGFIAQNSASVNETFLPALVNRHHATILADELSSDGIGDRLNDYVDSHGTMLPDVADLGELAPIDGPGSAPPDAEIRPMPTHPDRRRWSNLRFSLESFRQSDRQRPRYIEVDGSKMAYRVHGTGRPVVLLGGGIGGMDVWRGVIPHLFADSTLFSIDLVGFGESDRLRGSNVETYDWQTHASYFDACLDGLGLTDDLAIVSHGLNSMVAVEWARTHEDRLRGLGYIDGVLRPMAWPEAAPGWREIVKHARNEDELDFLVNSDDFMDEVMRELVPQGLRPASRETLRRSLGPPGPGRLAQVAALANVPLGGQPAAASDMMHGCSAWLKETELPKLLILGRPGYMLVNQGRKLATALPNQTVGTVDGTHLLPLTAPDAVGIFMQLWLRTL